MYMGFPNNNKSSKYPLNETAYLLEEGGSLAPVL